MASKMLKPSQLEELRPEKEYNILLIGKTGGGKSALGNNLLKQKVFKVRTSKQSVTMDANYGYSVPKGTLLKVIDCRGVCESSLKTRKERTKLISCLEKAVGMCPEGLNGILLVDSVSQRFSEFDRVAVGFLEEMFNPKFVRDYLIMALTHGDNFERDHEDDGLTFEEWCAQQTGDFKELMEKCNNRAIIFDNVTKDVDKKDDQIDELLYMINTLPTGGERYTDNHFQRVSELLHANGNSKEIFFRDFILKQCSMMQDSVDQLKRETVISKRALGFRTLHWRCEKLVREFNKEDINTEKLKRVNASLIKLSILFETKAAVLNRGEDGPSYKDLEDAVRQLQTAADKESVIRHTVLVVGGALLALTLINPAVAAAAAVVVGVGASIGKAMKTSSSEE